MPLGRLEILTVVVLLSPMFWRGRSVPMDSAVFPCLHQWYIVRWPGSVISVQGAGTGGLVREDIVCESLESPLRLGLIAFSKSLLSSLRDLIPIIAVIGLFQAAVVRAPMPEVASIMTGLVLVVIGLTLFVYGLEMGLFPIGESMAHAFARKGSVFWLMTFAFALGFATTIAEPALIAIANEAAEMAVREGTVADTAEGRAGYSLGLRLVVALAVGTAIVLGVLRILKGWPLHYLIIGGYVLVMAMTSFAPPEMVGIAYDSGGVTTSTITVPLVTALGVGLASSIQGRNPALDGFGLIAFASLTPMIFVLIYGMIL